MDLPDYIIQAFYPPNKGGGLAIATLHLGEASRDIEISVFKTRMARGEIDYIIVTNLVPPFGSYRIFGDQINAI